jgi:histone chaperone ASF1
VRFVFHVKRLLGAIHFPDIEWRLIYVASPGNAELDQELDDCLVGPVPIGVNAFEFEGSPPSPQSIPPEDVLGVAALILTGSYRDQEFVRVGYYQNTEYDNEEMKLAPPEKIQFEKLVRDISAKPRVTRFQIKWYVKLASHRRLIVLRCNGRDVSPQSGTVTAAGAANSAAVPSANDLEGDDADVAMTEHQSNGTSTS